LKSWDQKYGLEISKIFKSICEILEITRALQGEVRIVRVHTFLGEFFELEDATDIILILRRLSKTLPSRFLICVRVVLFSFVVI